MTKSTQKMIVLRDNSVVRTRSRKGTNFDFNEGPRPSVSNFEATTNGNHSTAEPELLVENYDKKNFSEASRDPSVVAVAESMSLSLVKPLTNRQLTKTELLDAPLDQLKADGVTWGIKEVGADFCLPDGRGVTVAVLDTGIDMSHEAFDDGKLNIVTKNFTGTVDNDTDGHGTHCAATIFGRDVDGCRIGVAPGVRDALIAKVIGGDAGTEALLRALNWAIENGANVISMSLGFDFPAFREALVRRGMPAKAATSAALQAYRDNIKLFDQWMALNAAYEASGKSAIVVAASGNESKRNAAKAYEISASSPSSSAGIVSVGALARHADGLNVASFSNTNPQISAPGVSIVSAKAGGGLVAMNGTSMACPHVAGVAALFWEELAGSRIKASSSRVQDRLLGGALYEDKFQPNTDFSDVGVGLAHAPG